MPKHTAQSLGKYLGHSLQTPYGLFRLRGIDLDRDNPIYLDNSGHTPQCIKIDNVYPILKDFTKLLELMEFEGKRIIPIKYIYEIKYEKYEKYEIDQYNRILGLYDDEWQILIHPNFIMDDLFAPDEDSGGFNPEIIEKLLNIGFGAIANSKSPTGYVDLFGYICVKED